MVIYTDSGLNVMLWIVSVVIYIAGGLSVRIWIVSMWLFTLIVV